ncbi:FecCD family ABC transporter permease [Salipaludibacillus sp. HK11]|uniref:FecCD family ABC transporter permease n=1 Tax=Salipaludibacillus sp. HK11 TaxID=3394320 RepID=UPI0039FBC730
MRRKRSVILIITLFFLCTILIGISIMTSFSGMSMTPARFFKLLTVTEEASNLEHVIMNTRWPRALMAMGVGVVLAIAGVLLQALFRNPLASPEITGVTQGAVTAAVVWISFGPAMNTQWISYTLPVISSIGGLIAGLVTWFLSQRNGKSNSLRLIMMGVLVGGILSAVTSVTLLLGGENTQALVSWLVGSLSFITWTQFNLFAIAVLISIPLIFIAIPKANLLHLGEDVAAGMGEGSNRAKIIVLIAAVLLTSSAVSIVGGIGFVGLVAPHLVRPFVGSDLRRLVPTAALTGGFMVLFADFVARNFHPKIVGDLLGISFQSTTLPVGIYLALLGSPFFLYIFLKKR